MLAVISIVYGAAVAFAQTDLKKLVAYSSVSHMGFVMLGIFSLTAAGLNGAVAVMFSHGIVTGMLFLMVGMVYDRAHTRQIADLSGLSAAMPMIGGLLAVRRRSRRSGCRDSPASSASSSRSSARGKASSCPTGSP